MPLAAQASQTQDLEQLKVSVDVLAASQATLSKSVQDLTGSIEKANTDADSRAADPTLKNLISAGQAQLQVGQATTESLLQEIIGKQNQVISLHVLEVEIYDVSVQLCWTRFCQCALWGSAVANGWPLAPSLAASMCFHLPLFDIRCEISCISGKTQHRMEDFIAIEFGLIFTYCCHDGPSRHK